jgi:hypothetical protein
MQRKKSIIFVRVLPDKNLLPALAMIKLLLNAAQK